MKVLDCKQGSTEWLQARCGLPTASEFDNLITPEGKPRTGLTPETYLLKKAAERVMGYPSHTGGTWAMEQGSLMESRALPWYEFSHDVKIQRVGFVTTDDGRIGCSPDGLIGDDGGIECKCPEAHTHLKYLLGGVVPKDYLAQVHGAMLVTGRKWWVFLSYNPYLPPLIVRVQRDERFIEALQGALNKFVTDLDAAHAKIQTLMKGTP